MGKDFWKAAGIRAFKTVCQTLVGAIPAGMVITPVMIQEANWSYLYIIGSWVGTALLAGLLSLLTSISKGLPEVKEK